MAVQLITGPAGSGKTDLALERLKQHTPLEWCHQVRLLVPTSEQAYRLRDRLLSDGTFPGILGNPICTFFDFASDIIAEAGLRAKLVSDLQKKLALADVVASERLSYFKNAASSPGFVDALGQIIGELKISMVDPKDLDKALNEQDAVLQQATKAKVRELLKLYQTYQQDILVAKLIHDREGVMWRALEIIRDRKLFEGYKLFILDGFDEFTGVQKEFIRLASQSVPEIAITLTYEEGRPEVFECIEPALEFIHSLGSVEAINLTRPERERTALDTLERSIFSADPEPLTPDDSITILEGGNIRMEAEMVAGEIVQLAQNGISYDDMAIVTRNIDSYYHYLADALRICSIPFVEMDSPLKETALAKFVATSVEVSMSGWHRDHVLPVLKSPFVSSDLVTACKVEIRAKQRGLTAGKNAWFEEWDTEDDTLEYRKGCLEPIASLDQEISQADSAQGFAQALKTFIHNLNWRSEPGLMARDAAAVQGISTVLDELVRTEELIDRKLPKEHLRELFLNGLSAATYRPQDASENGVSILAPESAVGQKLDVVFLVGMLEKVFPRQVREEPFFRDSERSILNRTLSGKLVERLSGQARERFLFYSTLTSARKKVYLSHPIADASASDSLPSFYIDEVEKLFIQDSIKKIKRDVGDVVQPPWEARTERSRLEGLVYGLTTGEYQNEKLAVSYNPAPHRKAVSDALQAAADRDAAITDERILKHTASLNRRFKPTEFESYASCPFKHFCSHTLGLEKVEDEVTSLNEGIIVHEVLYKLFSSLRKKQQGGLRLSELDPKLVEQEAASLLDETLQKDAMIVNLPAYILELERKKLLEGLEKFLRGELTQPSSYNPEYFELEFGLPPREGRERDPASTGNSLTLHWQDRHIQVCGKIDRVDLDPDTRRTLAVDYKLKNVPAQREFVDGNRFQAPIYALALTRVFNLHPVGVQYKAVTKPNSSSFASERSGLGKKTEEEWLEWLQKCEERAVEIAVNISACEIPISPAENACSGCKLDSICRIDFWKRLQLQTEGTEDGRA